MESTQIPRLTCVLLVIPLHGRFSLLLRNVCLSLTFFHGTRALKYLPVFKITVGIKSVIQVLLTISLTFPLLCPCFLLFTFLFIIIFFHCFFQALTLAPCNSAVQEQLRILKHKQRLHDEKLSKALSAMFGRRKTSIE